MACRLWFDGDLGTGWSHMILWCWEVTQDRWSLKAMLICEMCAEVFHDWAIWGRWKVRQNFLMMRDSDTLVHIYWYSTWDLNGEGFKSKVQGGYAWWQMAVELYYSPWIGTKWSGVRWQETEDFWRCSTRTLTFNCWHGRIGIQSWEQLHVWGCHW